jgi:hypothetical protein
MQAALTFNGTNICNPSNNMDGYQLTDYKAAQASNVEISIPGTQGRVVYQYANASTENESLKIGFRCQSFFSSGENIESFVESLEDILLDPDNNIAELGYDLINTGTQQTRENMQMDEFQIEKIEFIPGYNSLKYNVDFRVHFVKWGYQ